LTDDSIRRSPDAILSLSPRLTGDPTMTTVLVHPLDEASRPDRRPAPRLATLEGATVALLDIRKGGGRSFLDRIEERLRTGHGVKEVIRTAKPTFTRRAPDEVLEDLLSRPCDAVVEALAD